MAFQQRWLEWCMVGCRQHDMLASASSSSARLRCTPAASKLWSALIDFTRALLIFNNSNSNICSSSNICSGSSKHISSCSSSSTKYLLASGTVSQCNGTACVCFCVFVCLFVLFCAAQRSAHNAAIRGFLRYGVRWSWRVAVFVTLFK